ncbi:MAG TPA: F0F1 ATP synthase subunit gamma [Methylophilaceae bacterium]|nr:F0F1 ATP synthase subunit gamma [Methylophilaceae bacterium]
MSQRREVEETLELYDDLTGILKAMRSFALAELHRVIKRESAQRQVVTTLTKSMQDITTYLTPQVQPESDIWLLFGSVRGFCGSFNEDVLRNWREENVTNQATIVIGEKLFSTLRDRKEIAFVQGADTSLDAGEVIERVLIEIQAVQKKIGKKTGVVACFRDEDGPRIQRLIPISLPKVEIKDVPMVHTPSADVAKGVAEHYLFHLILSIQLLSTRVENHMRLMQMENALQHLEQGEDELNRKRNRMRQEEIVEEIELMSRKHVGVL